MISSAWRVISMVMYSFFRPRGSLERWAWLAVSIRGRSHVVNTIKGADRGSEKKMAERLMLLWSCWPKMPRDARLISMLCDVTLIHTMFLFDSHVRGISMAVGTISFSIVAGLGFVRSPCRMC